MKRFLCVACAFALCFLLASCAGAGDAGDAGDTGDTGDVSQENQDAGEQDEATTENTGGENSGQSTEKADYSTGTHIVEVSIEGYAPFEIELYADYAPRTVEKFCKLVERGYYDGMSLYALLPDMYARLGDASGKKAGKQMVKGEYEEAGFSNSLTLKRGVLAMGRTTSGTKSDASQLIVALSDLSYLDGKYAAFGKVSDDGMSVIDDIANKVETTATWKIVTDNKGTFEKKSDRVVITSMEVVE